MNDLRMILILGKRRQGKSTLAFALAINRHSVVVIFDPDRQYQHCADIPMYVANVSEIPMAMNLLMRAMENPSLGTTVIAVTPEKKIQDEVWNAFSDTVSQYPGGYAVIIDEAWNLQKANSINPKLQDMIRSSGNRPPIGSGSVEHNEDFTLIQTSHRFADLSTNVRSVATDFYIFRSTLTHDLDAIEAAFSPHVTRADVIGLGDHQAIHVTDDHNGGIKVTILADPRKWRAEVCNDDRISEVA